MSGAVGNPEVGTMRSMRINGRDVVVSDDQLQLSLMEYLREQRLLKGTKNGCNKGLCGTCTVVMDDKAVRACRTLVEKALGKSVITVEGMEYADGRLHPIQQAFLDSGAVQCGFCTPGMIMAAYALLLVQPVPDRGAIRKAMRGNLCRCTGYQQIVDAVELAARIIRDQGLSPRAGCLHD
jgi:carbon-monoxide dehydrogenase small subunit